MAMSSIGPGPGDVDYMQRDGVEGSGSGAGPDVDDTDDGDYSRGSGSGDGPVDTSSKDFQIFCFHDCSNKTNETFLTTFFCYRNARILPHF